MTIRAITLNSMRRAPALRFVTNSTTSKVNCGTSNIFDDPTTLSLGVIARPTNNVATTDMGLISKTNNGETVGWYFNCFNTDFRIGFQQSRTTTSTFYNTTTYGLPVGIPSVVVMTYNLNAGAGQKVKVWGAPLGQRPISQAMTVQAEGSGASNPAPGEILEIGNLIASGGNRGFEGDIFLAFACVNTLLSEDEIQQWARTPLDIIPRGSQGFWPMSRRGAATIFDHSSFGHHGTAVDTTNAGAISVRSKRRILRDIVAADIFGAYYQQYYRSLSANVL